MIDAQTNFLVDENGERQAVLVPWMIWLQIQEALEELDDLRAYESAKSKPSDSIPFEQAVQEIDEGEMA